MYSIGIIFRENQPRVYLLQAPILLRTGYICQMCIRDSMTPLLESKPDGTYGIKGGLLRPGNLAEFKKGMPDVDDETLYAEAEDFVKRYKGEFALFCRIRLGFSPTLTSIGQTDCIALVKTAPDFVKEVVDFYCVWMEAHIKNLMELGFDFLWDFDDMADKDGPFFTSEELQDVFLPHMKKAADKITIPVSYTHLQQYQRRSHSVCRKVGYFRRLQSRMAAYGVGAESH